MAKPDITAAQLREVLDYAPETGVFTNRAERFGSVAGKVTGTPSRYGYLHVKVFGRTYRAHRLVWLYVHGTSPQGQIDHINGDRSDNRIANLRDVSAGANSENKRQATARNRSGFLGVNFAAGKWVAQICTGGKDCYLGRFDTPEKAHEAYLSAKRKLHEGCTI
jgi:hypothetical protein